MRPEKRSFSIQGHRTSISLEAAFWSALKTAAAEDGLTLAGLINAIDKDRGNAGLSSAVRVWILKRLEMRAAAKSAE
ncbi:Arylsulfate sulfotransferase-related protein [Hyphomicrobium sp. GJ21]|uniref:ribbon-helix-helix domain-containing protein n=1 Tax=Hyphomicrobium sp. GJ21 TaxID=113574 RepID=UPI000622C158|nr:ribbon-helix-helix domain-containing protein [Hyphomicrobium sp. GJ21]CEJ87140.1 Arylsulfate sulfotransferase-related protein [Hyphomicrobium sp. GJ21]